MSIFVNGLFFLRNKGILLYYRCNYYIPIIMNPENVKDLRDDSERVDESLLVYKNRLRWAYVEQLEWVMKDWMLWHIDMDMYTDDRDSFSVALNELIHTNEQLKGTTLSSIDFVRIDLAKKTWWLIEWVERNLVLVFKTNEQIFSSIIIDLKSWKTQLKVKRSNSEWASRLSDSDNTKHKIADDEWVRAAAREVFATVGLMDTFDDKSFSIYYA